MKRLRAFTALAAVAVLFSACSEQIDTVSPSADFAVPRLSANQSSTSVLGYLIELDKSDNGNGTWTWTWKFTNTGTNPVTNANQGDISHFGLTLGQCLLIDDIIEASISTDGSTFASFTPAMAVDPSQSCFTDPILKFDAGASTIWYRLVIDKDYEIELVDAVLKGGTNFADVGTNCIATQVPGVGCAGGGGAGDPVYQYETAWGAGTRFVNRGNWATYFSIPNSTVLPLTVDLLAGQNSLAGSVTVDASVNPGYFDITYSTVGGWELTEIHLHVADALSGIPRTSTGNPIPGQFAYQYPPASMVPWAATTYTQTVQWSTFPMVVAAHAVVRIQTN